MLYDPLLLKQIWAFCARLLTGLVTDADAKHSQDVGWLKPFHGVNFLIEDRLYLPACKEDVYDDSTHATKKDKICLIVFHKNI